MKGTLLSLAVLFVSYAIGLAVFRVTLKEKKDE